MEDVEKDIMRGEFRGDFTRDTFNPKKNYSRVLMQQGRVQVDADWNEQVSIHLHYLRNLARDLGGPHWGPEEGGGFGIIAVVANDFHIGQGRYYVNGILCEVVDADTTYRDQPNYFFSEEEKKQNIISDSRSALIYLDVWERHISYVEDDAIREVALGGPDTATRAKIIWQVRVKPLDATGEIDFRNNYKDFLTEIKDVIKPGIGRLQARVEDKSKNDTEPCLVAPESRYRGAENQLYRVEIHVSGNGSEATFKWSRENAAVIFPILERIDTNESTVLSLEHLGRDERFSLKSDDWIEIVDDDYILHNNRAKALLQILSIDHENLKVTLKGKSKSDVGAIVDKHPYLRRWDQKEGDKDGIPISKISEVASWIDLEDGIQISFPALDSGSSGYQSGDYWLIPARRITGKIEWPEQNSIPQALLPHGVIHHYAPLALITQDPDEADDFRRIISISALLKPLPKDKQEVFKKK